MNQKYKKISGENSGSEKNESKIRTGRAPNLLCPLAGLGVCVGEHNKEVTKTVDRLREKRLMGGLIIINGVFTKR